MSGAKHKCIWRIVGGGAFGWDHVCGKSAAYEHQGKHYCKLHHPPTVYAKREARNAKWDAKREAEREVRAKVAADAAEQKRRADAFPDLHAIVSRLASLVDGLNNGNSAAEIEACRLAEQARALLSMVTKEAV